MNKLVSFDLLVVYSQSLAKSASDYSAANTTPFPVNSHNQSYNDVYGYFLEVCQQSKLTAAFTTSADITGPGLCRSYWKYSDNRWLKYNSPCFSPLIFDKFSPTTVGIKTRRQLLFSQPQTKPFNDPKLYNLFFDKQLTYEFLSQYAIPTVSIIGNTILDINLALESLIKLIAIHPQSNDFSPNIVMKDRFGAGGRRVYKFKFGEARKMMIRIHKNTRISYIIQPFVNFDQGFCYQNHLASTDIRLVYLQGEIIQSYIRVAKTGDFRCNEHRGGLLTYLSLNQIPATLVAKSNTIAKLLNHQHSLYSLDFIISNNGNSYLLEGNTGPGLDWNTSLSQNEIKAKKLIHLVVEAMAVRARINFYRI